jgi:pyridoxine kinase
MAVMGRPLKAAVAQVMTDPSFKIKVERWRGPAIVAAMPMVLVISSYVAASRVGGGIAPYVLAPMKIDSVHIPTCLFGRHPGWGPPGGTAVEADVMAKMLEGAQANGLYSIVDAVVTGHFSRPDQVAVAAEAIDRIRAAPRKKEHRTAPEKPIVIVDPVMGDEGPGLYIKEPVVEALVNDLVPCADIVAPNLWEFARLTGADLSSFGMPEDVVRQARAGGGRWLISSVPSPAGIGVLHVDGKTGLLAETPRTAGKIPNGTGDMLTLRFAGGLVSGFGVEGALADAAGATHAVIAKTAEWNGTELSLAACSDILAKRHAAPVRRIS